MSSKIRNHSKISNFEIIPILLLIFQKLKSWTNLELEQFLKQRSWLILKNVEQNIEHEPILNILSDITENLQGDNIYIYIYQRVGMHIYYRFRFCLRCRHLREEGVERKSFRSRYELCKWCYYFWRSCWLLLLLLMLPSCYYPCHYIYFNPNNNVFENDLCNAHTYNLLFIYCLCDYNRAWFSVGWCFVLRSLHNSTVRKRVRLYVKTIYASLLTSHY